MKPTNTFLKRCGKQRLEGKTEALTNNRNITQTFIAIATKISNSAYQLHSSKEIIRAAIADIENARNDYNA